MNKIPARSPFRARFLLILGLATTLLAGCAGLRREPANVGYPDDTAVLEAEYADLDLTPLAGRRILLDPGHGGFFPGVIGKNGLTEADANLGVALYLRGLLEWGGAEVHLTRTVDRDFLSPADSSLGADLAARVAMAETLQPDIFVSLHHNSNAALDRDLNETQTYYPVGRDGADLDLARALHRHLSLALGIEPAKIMAGNFYVLRNSPVVAALGEPSMLSNPKVEEKLFRADKLELEAKAYFRGILEYFSGGTPVWLDMGILDRELSPGAGFRPRGGAGLDPSTVRMRIDGRPVAPVFRLDGKHVVWDAPPGLPTGDYAFEISGRNLDGRATPVYSGTWRLGRTVAVHVDVIRENGGLDAPPRRLLRWRCVGPDGRAALVDEDFSVVIGSADDRGELHTSHIIGSPGRDAGAQLETGTEDLDLTVAACIGPFGERRPIELRTSESILPPGLRWTHAKRRAEIQPWHYRHLATAAGEIDPATVPNGGDTAVALPVLGCAWLERPGFRPIVAPRPRPDLPVEWTPTLPELMGRTILIDPAGGGAEHDGTGPLGTTGSELNLAMARRLADLLRACGARAHLTRDDVRHVPREEKVLQANRLGANLFLTIGRHDDAEGWRLTHHVGSRGGARWAAKVREAAGDLPAEGTVTIGESYAYLLRHTPCAALTCLLPGPIDVAAETRLAAPSHQQSTALAMLRAIAGVFSPDDDPPTALDVRRLLLDYPAHFPAPDDLDLMRINGGLLWLPPRVGEPSAPVPVRGDIVHLEIRSGGDWWLKILEPAAGGGPVITTRLAGIDGLIGPPEAFAPPALEQEDDAR